MMPRLVVLGSGTGVPTKERASPGLLLETEQWGAVLIDPGPGALHRMTLQGVPVEAVERVLLTHHHPDHTLDLMALLFARRNPWLEPRHLTVIGPVGTKDLYLRMQGLYGKWVTADEDSFSLKEVEPGPLADLDGKAFSTNHTEGSLGYRLELGKTSLAISGDTGPSEEIVQLGRDADLFLLECSVPDGHGKVPGHLTPREAGDVAARARPRKLVLYHLYPPVDAEEAVRSVRRVFQGETVVATDGAVFSL